MKRDQYAAPTGAARSRFAHLPHGSSELARALEGEVVLPADGEWDDARRAFNLEVDQRPAAVVFPESARDVATALLFAAERGQRVAAQGTGHNAGPLGPLENAILLRTDRMRGLTIDAEARIARVDAGVLWLEVVEAAARHGLAALAGTSHRTWGGGGGSLGVVTAIELRLFPITEVYAGLLWYPIEREREVLPTWRELTQADLPDELTTWGRFLNLPPVPEPLRGKSFVVVEVCHVGDQAHADELLAPLRASGL